MSDETPAETADETPAEAATPAPVGEVDPDAHVERNHLFALLYVKWTELPNGEGEDDDKEMVRLRTDIEGADRFKQPLLDELRIGPVTADRYWAHAWGGCNQCRCFLLEDGPDARPPQTGAQLVSDAAAAEERRKKQKIKFFVDVVLGTGFFVGATVTINILKAPKETTDGPEMSSGKFEIDPLAFLFMALILVASWFFAEAYGIAKELWVDFSAWKKAVPVVGKAWHAKGVNKKLEEKGLNKRRIGGGGAKPGSDS